MKIASSPSFRIRRKLVRYSALALMVGTSGLLGNNTSPATPRLMAQAAPHVTIRATTATAFEDGSSDGVFVISREGSTAESLTVRLSIGGTATNGVDYVTIPNEVQIPAGKPSVAVRVKPINDTDLEPDETVLIGLADVPINSTFNNTLASVVIKDNDTVVQITVVDPNGSETGPRPIVFKISRNGDLRSSLTVNYAVNVREAATRTISDGTSNTLLVGESSSSSSASGGRATSGVDFIALPSAITFSLGEQSKLLKVTPIDDTLTEGRESVVIKLLGSPLYTLGSSSSATGFIEDNDQLSGIQLPVVSITATQPNASEDGPPNSTVQITTGTVTLTRTGSVTEPLTVLYSINDTSTLNIPNPATNGVDFERLSGQVIIPAGASSATITVRPLHDNETEPEEQVVFQLFVPNPQTYSVQKASSQATVKIQDHHRP